MLFQETRESLKKIQKPVTDLRSVGLLPWLASEYTHGSKKEMDRKVKDFEKLYLKDITKYKEQLSNER